MTGTRGPRGGTFWWLARLLGRSHEAESDECHLPAAGRGDPLEAGVISALVGLALIGISAAVVGGWLGWLLSPLLAFLGLHLAALLAALAGELLSRAGILSARRRAAFQGAVVIFLLVAASVPLLAAGRAQAVLAAPLLGFIALELIALPARILWERTEP